MVAQPLQTPKRAFYVQWFDASTGEWRFVLDHCLNFAAFYFFPLAEEMQTQTAYDHKNCQTRIVDQLGNVYGIPLTIVEAVE